MLLNRSKAFTSKQAMRSDWEFLSFWTVREDDVGKVHFDTRQYNHLVWKSLDELEDQLYFFICAIVGKRNVAGSQV
jgi:hypothetical protein